MLTLVQCGYLYEHKEGLLINRESGTDFYVFVYFHTPAEIYLNGTWQDAHGKCVLYSPATPQLYRSKTTPYVNDWVHIRCDGNGDFFKKTGIMQNSLLECNQPEAIGSCVKNLAALDTYGGHWRAQIANNELENLIYRLCATPPHTVAKMPHPQYMEKLAAIRGHLYSSPQPGTKISELAAKAGLSASHFQLLYRQAFAISVGEDMVKGRIERACYLLQNSHYPINEVWRLSGYSCEEHFMRQFKKITGMTPKSYRKNH